MVTRREREREEMQQQIIDAARRLFVAEGYERVTIRKIADAIEYTPGAIYSYFEDKDAILHALHQQGFEELMRRLASAILVVAMNAGSPLEQLRTIGTEYIRFARENPELYDLMFVAQAPMRAGEEERWPEGKRSFDVLRGVVKAALAGGFIRPGDPEAIAFMLWSACHGMVTLEFRQRCSVIAEHARNGIAQAAFDQLMQVIAADRPTGPS